MTDNRTTELRRLLDERGIEYREHGGVSTGAMESYTRFVIDGDDGMVKAILETSEHSKAVLLTLRCTPEQAIAATLGCEECEFVECGICKFYHADIQLCEYGIPPCSKFERKDGEDNCRCVRKR